MTLEAGSPPTYAARRAAMADETRGRILDACVAILARGVAELSIPAVAREAGVSVPTVYRNFPDKKTLVQETALHLRNLRGWAGFPDDLASIPELLYERYEQAASVNETVRAALMSEPIMAVRRDMGEPAKRTADVERVFAPVLEALSATERTHAVRMIAMTFSSAGLRALREVTGVTPREAADTVLWTITRLLGRELTDGPRKKSKKRSKR